VQYFFTGIDELHKTRHATSARVVVVFAGALVHQADAHTVVQVAEFAQALAQYLVMELVVLDKDVGVGQKMHFGAAFVGLTRDAHGRDFHPINHSERMAHPNSGYKSKPIVIRQGAFIGASTIILKGVEIGERSVVGAGSVVTRSIGPDELWAGNPAVFIRKINA
jgi:acetyltransferase-like isoleucine patch superfamily enzyme